MIEVRKLVKRFGAKPFCAAWILQLKRANSWRWSGRMGAGKTTFLRVLLPGAPLRWATGQHRQFPAPAQAAEVRRSLGVVSHQPLLYGDLTAEENLRFYGKMYSVPELRDRIEQVLELVGLSARRSDLVRTFSRGMQQRLAIGRAIMHDPVVLLFDEPYTGLDQEACDMLDKVLREVAARGRTVVMTSHDLVRVADLASRFDVLAGGVIAASTTPPGLGSQNLLRLLALGQALAG